MANEDQDSLSGNEESSPDLNIRGKNGGTTDQDTLGDKNDIEAPLIEPTKPVGTPTINVQPDPLRSFRKNGRSPVTNKFVHEIKLIKIRRRRYRSAECQEAACHTTQPITEAEICAQLDYIKDYVNRGGKLSRDDGSHAVLKDCKFPPIGSLLRNRKNLRYADFSGTDFGGADVTNTDFTDCDLTCADMSGTFGLIASQLSGANLTRCKLPEHITDFAILKTVETLSQNAGKVFLTTLMACIFVLLTAFSTYDIQLLTNSGTAQLPALNVSVSTQIFFSTAPFVLLILSITVHLYLQRLWETMATLPAIFPDGVRVDNKTYPWLINDLIRDGFLLLHGPRTAMSLSGLQVLAFRFIAYGTVPATLLIVFLRCLSRHDLLLSWWQAALTALGIGWATYVSWLNRSTLAREMEEVPTSTEERITHVLKLTAYPALAVVLWTIGLGAMINYACTGMPVILSRAQQQEIQKWDASRSGENRIGLERVKNALQSTIDDYSAELDRAKQNTARTRDVPFLEDDVKILKNSQLQIDTYSQNAKDIDKYFLDNEFLRRLNEMSKAEVPWAVSFGGVSPGRIMEDTTRLTEKWKPGDNIFPNPPAPPISGKWKRLIEEREVQRKLKSQDIANMHNFLQNGDPSALKWRNGLFPLVQRASFRSSNLRYLQARGAFLINADFRGADMTSADFSEADLRNATFQPAVADPINLSFATLSRAKAEGQDFSGATMIGADLHEAILTGADLSSANLIGADLSGAMMASANLSGAKLVGADLQGANLRRASIGSAMLIGADVSGADLEGAYYPEDSGPNWPDKGIPAPWRPVPMDSADPRAGGLKTLWLHNRNARPGPMGSKSALKPGGSPKATASSSKQADPVAKRH